MTYVTIIKTDKDVFAKALIEYGYKPEFYTVENNDRILRMGVPELSPGMLFQLGSICGSAAAFDRMKEII